ncbi:hypothetical protein NQ317_007198 [Molorchus minor]|uniref:Uncharacterized protein n=1 Tax=Molorchus minor TaxID=1323400 RepID=A0ABQ9JQS7_9CUCU|nr:hypothetical protein NQ317_007198 [Molorchus minor]
MEMMKLSIARNRKREKIPLAVAGGGGGLGLGRFSVDSVNQHGQAINTSRPPFNGKMYSPKYAGSGGGWSIYPDTIDASYKQMMGSSLQVGGIGGMACYNSTDHRGDGGFGGGGGGCRYGGGGGGFSGGDAPSANTTNGEGGYSFIDPSKTIPNFSEAHSGYNPGAGYVLIIPAITGCDCEHSCVALDAKRSQVTCICPNPWKLAEDKKTCIREFKAVDKLLSMDTAASSSKISPVAIPNNMHNHSNHNNNLKTEYSLKSGVSLDAAALAKQAMTPSQNKKYANITTGESIKSNGFLQNDPFSTRGSKQNFLNESEINC